jgi:hypothetical protein
MKEKSGSALAPDDSPRYMTFKKQARFYAVPNPMEKPQGIGGPSFPSQLRIEHQSEKPRGVSRAQDARGGETRT